MKPDGYELFFNRDEASSRGTAHPPEVFVQEGLRYVAPLDSDAGGTWLATNEYGLSVALANYYARGGNPPAASRGGGDAPTRGDRPGCGTKSRRDISSDIENREYTSRGLLVLSLVDGADLPAIRSRLQGTRLSDYRPFLLIVVSPGQSVTTLTWDGMSDELTIEEVVRPPIATSGDPEGRVLPARRRVFNEMTGDGSDLVPATLEAFHRSHKPEKGIRSPCMPHPKAGTVSMSRVSVDEAKIRFFQAPGPPGVTPFSEPIRLTGATANSCQA